ncbi:MAG: SDR family oxidoreductase [archaeon]|nr:SDR family oxidoreductase [archaeon]
MNKVCIIAGATGGVGKTLSGYMAQCGYDLALFGKDRRQLEKTKDEIQAKVKNVKIITEIADFEKPAEEEIKDSFSRIIDRFKKIDCLVNCIGLCAWHPIEEMPLAVWDNIISINLTSTYLLNRYAVIYMKKQKKGVIINISSTAGKKGAPNSSAYCASKFGVVGLSYSLAEEVADDGIKVIVLVPGAIKTDFVRKGISKSSSSGKEYAGKRYLKGKGVSSESIAECIVQLLKLSDNIMIKEVIL